MPEVLKRLINTIGYLPGIGEKSATKLAFFLLNSNNNYIDNFIRNLNDIKSGIGKCNTCNILVDLGKKKCNICNNQNRNKNQIAIIEEYLDYIQLEESGGYNGVYHVLGGAISPINGVFVSDLNFDGLFERIKNSDNKIEIILATNPNIEGEATANYIIEEIEKRKLKYKVKITRLSRGLSSGYIEYADNMTLINAIRERKEV